MDACDRFGCAEQRSLRSHHAASMPPLTPLDPQDRSGLWKRFCSLLWHDQSQGIWLDVSRMALSDSDFAALEPRFQAAFTAMQALEAGAIANADEQRQVGHYWLRNPALAPDPAAAELISREIEGIASFAADVLAQRLTAPQQVPFTDVLWIGIGEIGRAHV